MKKFNKKLIISSFIFCIISLLSISIIIANNTNKENFDIDEEKIYHEIKYIDSQIIYMTNLLNNIENKTNFYINWDELQKQTKTLYNYWNSVILDLNYLTIEKRYLTDFGENLDNLMVSVKNNNKHSTFINLLDAYNKLIIYSQSLNYNNYSYVITTKYNLLCAYATTENGNWTLVHEYILEASKNISKVVNSMEINQYSQYNINQTFVAIKELENLINIKDLNVFYFKYKNAIDKLESLTF